jgi:hypothetical protein
MANKIRITAPGWETYTGNFGGVDFSNGLSNDILSRKQIDFLCGLVACDLTDEEGNAIAQGGIAARLVGGVNVGEAPTSLRKATQDEIDADRRDRLADAGRAPTKIYTKDELTTIAQKEGINGLRAIGDKWSVRDRSINKLILLIVQAQAAFVARNKDKEAMLKASREKATADALAKEAARMAVIDAKARLVTTGGTSNAIGPDGQNVTVMDAPPAKHLGHQSPEREAILAAAKAAEKIPETPKA